VREKKAFTAEKGMIGPEYSRPGFEDVDREMSALQGLWE